MTLGGTFVQYYSPASAQGGKNRTERMIVATHCCHSRHKSTLVPQFQIMFEGLWLQKPVTKAVIHPSTPPNTNE